MINNHGFIIKSNQIESNQIKSLLLSHHHSTSALVSEILMSVLQTVQKNNRQFTYGQTVQKKQQTIYIWTDSAKKTTNNLHMDRQCKKTTAIYIWTDSAKKTTNNLHMDRQCKKTALEHLQCSRQCKKQQQQQFTYGQTVPKNNSNLHMDSTYLQTTEDNVQNTHTYTQYT